MAEVLHPSDSQGFDTHILCPIIKPYYKDGFGSKSIGEPQWRPHPRNALSVPDRLDNTVKGGNGLDWFSSLRCASLEDTSPHTYSVPKQGLLQVPAHYSTNDSNSSLREQAFEVPEIAPRSAPVHKELLEERPTQHWTQIEYDTYDDFEKIYERRPLEISLRMSVGAKKEVYNKRNGIPATSLGDKSYQVPEYSPDFHKHGSTRPVINFGGSLKYVPDTFVPLQDLPMRPRVSFEEKERRKLRKQEIDEVKNLDCWRPANPLSPVLQLPGIHG